MTTRDRVFGLCAGIGIGLLVLPIIRAASPAFYMRSWPFVVPAIVAATYVGLEAAALIARRIAIVWQIATFGVIGVLNTVVDLGALTLLIAGPLRQFDIASDQRLLAVGPVAITVYTICKSASFTAAVVNSYFWNKHWTFAGATVRRTRAQFLQFFTVSIIGFFINVGVASYLFQAVRPYGGLTTAQWGLIGAATGSIAGLAWNFLGYKFVVFKDAALE